LEDFVVVLVENLFFSRCSSLEPIKVVVVVEAVAAAAAKACCFIFFRILLAIVGFIFDSLCVVSRATVLFCVDLLALLLPSVDMNTSEGSTEYKAAAAAVAVMVKDADGAAPFTLANFLRLCRKRPTFCKTDDTVEGENDDGNDFDRCGGLVSGFFVPPSLIGGSSIPILAVDLEEFFLYFFVVVTVLAVALALATDTTFRFLGLE
jgi:hypothetical protein